MKTYTFTLNTSNNPSNSRSNASKAIDALILSNLKKSFPYLGGKANDDDTFIIKSKKAKKTIDIDITLKKGGKKTPKKATPLGLFIKALAAMADAKDTYDFKLDDGTPIKIFSDEIQIGYDLYTLENGYKEIANRTSDAKKKTIIDIFINN